MDAAPDISFVATSEKLNPGIVVWWLPYGTSLDAWKIEARQFAIESDLLIGALIKNEQGALLVGRARQAPLFYLPSMRVEILQLLSKVQEFQLVQSFERNYPLIYPLADGWDWCPPFY